MEFDKEHLKFYAYVETCNGGSAKDIHSKLAKAVGDKAPGYSTIKRWCKDISDNNFSVQDAQKTGRPSSSNTKDNITKISNLIEGNPRLSTRQLAEEIDLNKETVRQILVGLGLRKICSVWVPHSLTQANKEKRVEMAHTILAALQTLGPSVPRLYAVIDETWVVYAPLGTKQENKVWLAHGAKRHQIPRPALTKDKSLLTVIYTANGKFNCQALPYGVTINSDRYCDFLRQTGDRWRTLRSDPTRLNEISLQQDNARPHTSATTTNFLTSRSVTRIAQPPYSPDYNMLDRWVFAYLKKSFRKVTFTCPQQIEDMALQLLRAVPLERMSHEIEKLKSHLANVINNHGSYIA